MTASAEPSPITDRALLSIRGLCKSFGGLAALSEVSFDIQRGEVFGLIGPNGAGKTTLFNLLTGLYSADRGDILLDNRSLLAKKPHDIAACGLARTFQNIRLFAQMTALENIMVGRHVRTHAGVIGAIVHSRAERDEESAILQHARGLLAYVGLTPAADQLAKHLPYGDQRRLEIARALATEPKLLALDEPAAGMNPSETQTLLKLLQRIRTDGVTLLLIEHDMHLVMNLCDRVAVLDYGKKIAEGKPNAVQQNPQVIEAYLGGSFV